jgi:DNA-binding transcriptional ArsR family regulator
MESTIPPRTYKKNLGPRALAMVAARFRLLAEPARLSLLHALMDGERTVNALVEQTGLSQANVSKHLSLLADAGFIERRREGLFAWYGIADPAVFELCDLVCASLARKLGHDLNELT